MKNLILGLGLLISIGCGNNFSSNTIEPPVEQISDDSSLYSIDQFLNIGFKVNKEYDVSALEMSSGVWFGFWKNGSKGALDYEIRIYPSHQLALEKGVKYVEEVIGENAILKKSTSSWQEGIQDRRLRSDRSYKGSSANTIRPKYLDYIVYSNTIILCGGLDLTDARLNCSDLINSLEK